MSKLNKTLQSKHLFIIGIVGYLIGFLIGGIIGNGLELIGFITFVIAVLALNRELKERKKTKRDWPKIILFLTLALPNFTSENDRFINFNSLSLSL